MALKTLLIDFKKLVFHVIDGLRRDVFTVDWIHALLGAVRDRHDRFVDFAAEKDDELFYGPGYKIQVEQLLLDKIGPGIFIVNNRQIPTYNYAFDRGDARNLYMWDRNNKSNVHLWDRGAFDLALTNFTVYAPIALQPQQSRMEGYLNKYKSVGMSYNIVYF